MSSSLDERPAALDFTAPRRGSRRAKRAGLRHRAKAHLVGDMQPLPVGAGAAIWTLLCVTALAIWFSVYAVFLSGIQERRNNAVLYSHLRQGLSAATTPFGGAITPGTPVALLESGVQGLRHTVIVEATASRQLTSGPGHRRDTPLPGQPGVSVLLGKSLTYGAPFGHLANFRPGDKISITTAQGKFAYSVEDVRRKGDAFPAELPVGGSAILLETSTGSRLQPTQTLYVDAILTSKPVAAPDGRLPSVPPAERAWHSDQSGMPVLVLWLQLLAIVVGATVWAKFRWGGRQSWLVGAPLLLAALWGATGNVLLLLPNLV